MPFELKIIETPRDAFQGIPNYIPTQSKVRIINLLLKAGFDTVEVGSFVSKEAIPQMRDTAEVLKGIDTSGSKSRIMVLVGNKRGGNEAVQSSKGKVQIDEGLRAQSVGQLTTDHRPPTADRELRTANCELNFILTPFDI